MKGCRSGRAPARVLMGLVLLGLPACQVVQGVKEATVSAAKEVSGRFFGGPDPATPRAPVRSPTATTAGDSHAPSPTTQPLVKKAGCPDFTPFSARQKEPEWCWAASAQMVYKYLGRDVPQELIANRIRGASDIQSAGYFEVLRALTDHDVDWGAKVSTALKAHQTRLDAGSFITAFAGLIADDKQLLVEQLEAGQPCVVGLILDAKEGIGHACVAHEVQYTEEKTVLGALTDTSEPPGRTTQARTTVTRTKPTYNRNRAAAQNPTVAVGMTSPNDHSLFGLKLPTRSIHIVSVKIFDPDQTKGGERTLTGAELDEQLDFIVSHTIAERFRQYLDNAMKSQ